MKINDNIRTMLKEHMKLHRALVISVAQERLYNDMNGYVSWEDVGDLIKQFRTEMKI